MTTTMNQRALNKDFQSYLEFFHRVTTRVVFTPEEIFAAFMEGVHAIDLGEQNEELRASYDSCDGDYDPSGDNPGC